MKFLVLGLILAVVGWLFFGLKRRPLARREEAAVTKAKRAATPAAQPGTAPAEMRQCAHCAVHLPEAEALFAADGQAYCSAAHRDAGARPPR